MYTVLCDSVVEKIMCTEVKDVMQYVKQLYRINLQSPSVGQPKIIHFIFILNFTDISFKRKLRFNRTELRSQ